MRLLTTFVFIIIFSLAAFSQREAIVHGEYTYRGPESVSITEAKRIASENAKIQAIETEFGSSLTRSVFHNLVDENGIGKSKMLVFGGNDLKGEWIGTQKEEFTSPVFENGEITFTVKVSGVARKSHQHPLNMRHNCYAITQTRKHVRPIRCRRHDVPKLHVAYRRFSGCISCG